MSTKEQLHNLVDLLPEEEVVAASRYLQFLVNDVEAEALTEDDWHEVRAGEAAIANGEFTTLADLKRELKFCPVVSESRTRPRANSAALTSFAPIPSGTQ